MKSILRKNAWDAFLSISEKINYKHIYEKITHIYLQNVKK